MVIHPIFWNSFFKHGPVFLKSCTIEFRDSNRRMPVNNSVSLPFLDEDGHAFKLRILNSSAKSTHWKNQRFKCKTKFREHNRNIPSTVKIVISLKLLSRYLFLPISPLARTAYMLRRFSQQIGMPTMSMCRLTPWFSRQILACTLWIFLPLLSLFKLTKYLGKDITQIPGLTAWESTPLRTSRKFMHTQE